MFGVADVWGSGCLGSGCSVWGSGFAADACGHVAADVCGSGLFVAFNGDAMAMRWQSCNVTHKSPPGSHRSAVGTRGAFLRLDGWHANAMPDVMQCNVIQCDAMWRCDLMAMRRRCYGNQKQDVKKPPGFPPFCGGNPGGFFALGCGMHC